MADVKKLAKKIAEKIPYKISEKEGELILKSPKASATGVFMSPETMAEYDSSLQKIAEEQATNPFYIPALEAEKGYGKKALEKLEKAAKKRGADIAYLNASPLGGTRGLSQEQAAEKLREFYKKQGYNVAEDQKTNTIMWKKLGLTGDTQTLPSLANPAELVQKAYGTYTKGVGDVAKKIADKIYETTSAGVLTKEQQAQDPARKVLEFGTEMAIDPLNYLGPGEIKALGAVAAGIKGIKKEKAVKAVAEKLIQNAKKATESRKFEPVVSSKWGTVIKDVPLPAKELAESVAPAGSHSGVELATKWEGSREFGKEPLGVSRGQGLAVRKGEIESAKDAAARYLQYLQKMKKPKLP